MMTATSTKTAKAATPSVADDPRWARIVARDKTADGHLWYSVSTTGVYCRPSCPSRTANPWLTFQNAAATYSQVNRVEVSMKVLEAIAAEGIDHIFAVMGSDANQDIVVELCEKRGLKYIHTHHETTAVGMADGYSRLASPGWSALVRPPKEAA
jgi:methylphosphotriester-DNA--protein-cysteine methyltransferase